MVGEITGSMNFKRIILVLIPAMIVCLNCFAQCDVRNRVGPDGTMYYYLDAARFYYTPGKQLHGGVVTDKEHYFLSLLPAPFPQKKEAAKLKDNAKVTLSNGRDYELDNFSSRYNKEDSVFLMMFLIPTKAIDDFSNFDIESVTLNMGKSEGLRTYQFSLHKSAVREHLACFLKMKED